MADRQHPVLMKIEQEMRVLDRIISDIRRRVEAQEPGVSKEFEAELEDVQRLGETVHRNYQVIRMPGETPANESLQSLETEFMEWRDEVRSLENRVFGADRTGSMS